MAAVTKSIYLLYTGGTIGCIGQPLSPMPAADFATAFNSLVTPTIEAAYPGVSVVVDATDSPLDSTNMQPSEWLQIAGKIMDNYDANTSFLILHGTDTMAWTSSALSFLFPGLSKPVTVSGSQLPLFYESTPGAELQLLFNTDALRNVLGAVAFFTFNIPEVTLYFSDTLFRGNRTVKSNSSAFVAFSSPNYPALGHYGVDAVLESEFVRRAPGDAQSMSNPTRFAEVQQNIATISAAINYHPVIQFEIFPGYYTNAEAVSSSLLAHMLSSLSTTEGLTLSGYILESYGIGNIPSYPSMQKAVTDIVNGGAIVVDCTQVQAGGTDFNEYATGSWLGDAGVISANDMTPLAAMAKLTILFAQYGVQTLPAGSRAELETAMGSDLAGELTNYYALSSFQNEYLAPGESLVSISGQFQLENRKTGGLILYDLDVGSQSVFVSEEPGRLIAEKSALVLYDESRNVVKSFTCSQSDIYTFVQLEDDGKLSFYNLDTGAFVEYVDMSSFVVPVSTQVQKPKKKVGRAAHKRRMRKSRR